MMKNFFFSSWELLFRIAGIGVLSYLSLVLILRLTGNRTLSQMNSFDFIITVALGSTFSAGMMNKNISLAETMTGLFVLVCLQWIITKLSVHSKKVSRLVKSEPVLLFYRGTFFHGKMNKARVNEDEIMASIRQDGMNSLEQVEAVVLETNGNLSAVPKAH